MKADEMTDTRREFTFVALVLTALGLILTACGGKDTVLTVPTGAPWNFTGAPSSRPFTVSWKKETNVVRFVNQVLPARIAVPATMMMIAPIRNDPMAVGFARMLT